MKTSHCVLTLCVFLNTLNSQFIPNAFGKRDNHLVMFAE